MSRFGPQLLRNLQNNNIKPIIILDIEGFPFLIGSDTIKKIARYGDEGLFYGMPAFVYGGLVPLSPEKQKTLITTDGITKSITQTLDIDKGSGSSISSFSITLTDLNGEATKIASGVYDGELLYRNVTIWIGFTEDSDFNADYKVLFRGVIESFEFQQAKVKFNFASVDIKRKQATALKHESETTGSVNNSITNEIFLTNTTNLINIPSIPINGGPFLPDPDIKLYIKLEDEYIEYEFFDTSPSGVFNLVRGQLGSAAVSHASGASVEGMYVLNGNPIDLALKLMLSKEDEGPFITLEAASVQVLPDGSNIKNAVYFPAVNLIRDYNLTINDNVILSGFSVSGNNLAGIRVTIDDIQFIETGTYVVINQNFPMFDEPSSTGTANFYCKYNRFGDLGVGMNPNEVDIKKFEDIRDNFLNDAEVLIYIRDEIENTREWIEQNLLFPFTCYSLPNDSAGLARQSMGIHLPPLPIEQIQTIDITTVTNPNEITSRRSAVKYHYNGVGFRYEDTPDDGELRRKVYFLVGSPQIATGNKLLVVDAIGLRESNSAYLQAQASSTRFLNRYKNAAIYFSGIKVLYSVGVLINIGDRIVFDATGLNVVDPLTGRRARGPFLAEVINKTEDPFSGTVSLDIIDTNFDLAARYGLISPSSIINKVVSNSRFVIQKSFGGTAYGNNEYRKWEPYVGAMVAVRSLDFTEYEEVKLYSVTNNTIVVEPAVSFDIQEGYVLELSSYSSQPMEKIKLIYAHLSDGENNFSDGKPYYRLI